jgi:hypothetical protein
LKAYWLFFAQWIFDCLRDASNSGTIASGIAKRWNLAGAFARQATQKVSTMTNSQFSPENHGETLPQD